MEFGWCCLVMLLLVLSCGFVLVVDLVYWRYVFIISVLWIVCSCLMRCVMFFVFIEDMVRLCGLSGLSFLVCRWMIFYLVVWRVLFFCRFVFCCLLMCFNL